MQGRFSLWMKNSLLGHIVLSELIGTPIVSIILIGMFYYDGGITFGWALYTVFVSALGMAMMGAFLWFFITLKLLRNR